MQTLSQEWIASQVNDYFVEEGTKIVEQICEDIDNKVYKNNAELYKKSRQVQKLTRLVMERFGILVTFPKSNSADLIGSHALPPVGYVEDILYSKPLKGLKEIKGFFGIFDHFKINTEYTKHMKMREKILAGMNNEKGEVSFKTAKVSGYLSKIPALLAIDFYNHRKHHKLTSRQMLAVTLHEIGHIFHGLAHRHYTDVINISLQNFVNEMNRGNDEKAVYAYNHGVSNSGMGVIEYDPSLPRQDLAASVFISATKNISVISHDLAYQRTFSENSADVFATRMGLGVEMSQALEKVYTAMARVRPGPIVQTLFILHSVINATVLFAIILAPMLGSFFSWPVLFLLVNSIVINQSGSANRIDAYDNDKDRFQRILNNMVRELKKITNESPEMISKMIDDIEVVQDIVSRTKPGDMDSYYDRLSNLLRSSNRKAVRVKKIQRNIENMAANKLFVQSLQLLDK